MALMRHEIKAIRHSQPNFMKDPLPMNSTPNFASILDEAPTEVIRPKTTPAGTYLCIVGNWTRGTSSKKKTPFIQFELRPVQALDDVDPAELGDIDLTDRKFSITFYTTPDAIFMMDQFHTNCGLDLAKLGKVSRLDRCDQVANSEVLAVVEHEISEQDPERVFARVNRTAKVS